MKVLVVGAGAIGCLVGGRLAVSDHQVTLLGRKRLVDAVTADGLHLRWPNGTTQTVHPTVIESMLDLNPEADFDLVLVSVKFGTAEAVANLEGKLSAHTRILSLQNGVGNEALLAQTLPNQPIVAGSITLPVMIPEVGTVEVSKEKGGIGLAPFSANAPLNDIAQALEQAGFAMMIYADHRSLKWSKLMMNIIGNASSAILDMPPGQSFIHAAIFDLELDALRETLAVMAAQKIQVAAILNYPLPMLATALRWLPNWLLRPALRGVMVGGRGDKLPSLQIELRQGRNESEVEVLNGVVARCGEQLGIPVPVNRAFTDILLGIVEGRIPWESYRGNPQKLVQFIRGRVVSTM